ncbi:DUF983 domain-containing protein [Olivibacter sp. CPCC 100613]|uniref:DUF983 domain-containing protein n=1 Tax=Olivibacter sp. CPCC 100613 TaxID=3079931 RepID=UPI002FFD3DD5
MENSKEISEWNAALHARCPRCRTGAMFTGKTYGFKVQKMNENCPHCNLKFEREPGYFYVAMFVSYAMNVAELIAACVGTYLLTGNLESPWLYLGVALGTAFLLSPLNYRYSRVILLFWLTPGLRYTSDFAHRAKE